MLVKQGAELLYQTDNDDHDAVVLGPTGAVAGKKGERLPTDDLGFHALSVIDRQKRVLQVTLAGGAHSSPPSVTDVEKGRVVFNYRVVVALP